VVESQGRDGKERVPGRLSWARQYRGVRSQQSASARRHLEQADGTAWMCMFLENMLQIAIELSASNPLYIEMALKSYGAFSVDSVRDGRR